MKQHVAAGRRSANECGVPSREKEITIPGAPENGCRPLQEGPGRCAQCGVRRQRVKAEEKGKEWTGMTGGEFGADCDDVKVGKMQRLTTRIKAGLCRLMRPEMRKALLK